MSNWGGKREGAGSGGKREGAGRPKKRFTFQENVVVEKGSVAGVPENLGVWRVVISDDYIELLKTMNGNDEIITISNLV